MKIHAAPNNFIEMLWPIVYPYLRKSFRHAPDPKEANYFPEILKTDTSLMLVLFFPEWPPDIVCGSAILQDTGESLHVRHLAGRLPKNWAFIFDAWLVDLARSIGRPALTSQGRKGWDKILFPLGWQRINGKLYKGV